MKLIICEDEHLLVVNKPAGWNTHAPSPFAGEGIYDWLKHREPRWARLAIIHRLDKETSGLIVFGKTSLANKSLTEQFASRAVRKKYLLLTDRRIQQRQFTARSNIVRTGEKYVSRTSGDERAETHFRVLHSSANATLVEAEPVTGRTHQIRVHAAEHGFPILGDVLYGGTPAERVFLHATEISFRHPETKELMNLSAAPDWSADRNTAISSPLRAAIIEPAETNAFRLIHGASDGWPGWYLDKLGDWLLSQSEQPLTNPQHERLRRTADHLNSRGTYHKRLSRHVRAKNVAETSSELLFGATAPEWFTIRENGLRFELSFTEGYSVGLFLDQRDNRRRLLVNHASAGFMIFPNSACSAEVLNTFGYTCGFSVAAAKAGARTTSLDLSKKYLEWGKRNFWLNQLDPAAHDFIYGDAFDWMRRLAKKGRRFDCVILDPPTFSQSKETRFSAERDYGKLAALALPLLKPSGVLFASTNAARPDAQGFLHQLATAITKAGRKITQQHYVPQPPDFPISREDPAYLKTVWMRVQ